MHSYNITILLEGKTPKAQLNQLATHTDRKVTLVNLQAETLIE